MRLRICTGLCLPILVLGSSLLAANGARAQPGVGTLNDMKAKYDASNARRLELIGGGTVGSKDQAVAAAVAQYHIYRISHKFDKGDPQADLAKEVAALMDKKGLAKRRPYIDLFGKECVESMKLVLARDIVKDPVTIVHASQMLPTMAKLRQDDVSAYLVEMIQNDKTHDVIRLHALKAMKETMPVRQQQEPFPTGNDDYKDAKQNAERKRDSLNVDALTSYIERKVKIDNTAPGDAVTLRFVRREAVVALASAGSPAVTAHGKYPLAGKVAPTLMRVIAKNGGITPTPSLAEKVEAAIGLCNLEYPYMSEYNADLAVSYVGQTILEFANEYNKDWGNFVRLDKDRLASYHPFKTDGKRLQASLISLTNNAQGKNKDAFDKAKDLQIKAKSLLDRIVIHDRLEVAPIEAFSSSVSQWRPKTGAPFKTLKAPDVPE